MANLENGKIRLSEKEANAIALTSPSECTIYDYIYCFLTYQDAAGRYINLAELEKEGFVDHLKRVVGSW